MKINNDCATTMTHTISKPIGIVRYVRFNIRDIIHIKTLKDTAINIQMAHFNPIAIQSVIGIEVGVTLANAIPALGNE